MSQLDTMLQSIRNKKSDDLHPITEGIIKNHFMKGKIARSSYLKLLQFTQQLLKPYGMKYEAGSRFIEKIYRSLDETCSLDALMTQVLQLEEKDVHQWITEIRTTGGNSAFALDALQLYYLMEAGEQGLESISGLFSLMALDSQLTTEAAKAAKFIIDKDTKGVLMTDWQLLSEEKISKYFGNWNPDEKVLLEAAESLFIRDRTTQAYPLFQKLVNKGNPRAFYFMGIYYRFGLAGLAENEKLEVYYYHLGAEKGDLGCQLQLAYFEEEANQEKIIQAVIPETIKLAQTGDIVAENELGYALEGNSAESWLKKAAESGYWFAALTLADAYRDGEGIRQDMELAIGWYKQIYQLHGDHAGTVAFRIGDIYEEQKNDVQAFEWYKKGAVVGEGASMYRVALCYKNGNGTDEDQREAIKWLEEAYALADKDDRTKRNKGFIAREIGHIYREQENGAQAFEWYKKGAEAGNGSSILKLGLSYKYGVGTDKDQQEALKWLTKAYTLLKDYALLLDEEDEAHATKVNATRGKAARGKVARGKVAWEIGDIYNDQGDDKEALKWLQKAYTLLDEEDGADATRGTVASEIGDIYNDQGDDKEALKWLQKAYTLLDEEDEARGIVAWQIGDIYNDQGDDKEALKWLQKAYTLLDEDDEARGTVAGEIGDIYNGQGDHKEALKWLQKAIDCYGDAEKEARETLDELEDY